MGNTYTQLHIQIVFAVKFRASLIDKPWKNTLHQYITTVVQEDKHKMLQINSMPDHLHFFIGLHPDQSISTLVQKVKRNSNLFINDNGLCKSQFAWQQGFGAFSYSKSHVHNVIRYIQNQEAHHKSRTFLAEYQKMLTASDVVFDKQYIFKEPQ